MKEINKFFYITIITFFSYIVSVESKILSIGNSKAKVTVKVFSSLTCPHCANFHVAIFNNLKRDYIDKGLVKFEHHAFPLDLAALNAAKVAHCKNDGFSDILHFLFINQKEWVKGKNILEVNNNLGKLLNTRDFNINFEECVNNKIIEDFILEERIDGSKKYEIQATPTLIINEKKFDKPLNFKNINKSLKKML